MDTDLFGRENGRGIYKLVSNSSSLDLSCFLSHKPSSLELHLCLKHPGIS